MEMEEEQTKGRNRRKGERKGGGGRDPHIFQLPFLEEEDEEEREDEDEEEEPNMGINRASSVASVVSVASVAIAGEIGNTVETASTNETTTTDDNDDNSIGKPVPDPTQPTSAESWAEWKAQFQQDFQSILSSTLPGAFAIPVDEKYFQCCKYNKFPRELAYVLRLPLRFVLCKGKLVGCTLNRGDCEVLVKEINKYWKQAGIQFFLIDEVEVKYFLDRDYYGKSLYELREGINSLARGPDGKMAGKEQRRDIFLQHLMKDRSFDSMEAFNVWVFDFIGNTSQGVSIDRDTHTVIIGQRSNKGYPEITVRPLDCLGKTISHELGHALSLEHLIQRPFSCGTARNDSGMRNIMEGGSDVKGGGGGHLDDWQILQARGEACRIMQSTVHKQLIKHKDWKRNKSGTVDPADMSWQFQDIVTYWVLLLFPILSLLAIAYYAVVNNSTYGYIVLIIASLLLLFFGTEWTAPQPPPHAEAVSTSSIESEIEIDALSTKKHN